MSKSTEYPMLNCKKCTFSIKKHSICPKITLTTNKPFKMEAPDIKSWKPSCKTKKDCQNDSLKKTIYIEKIEFLIDYFAFSCYYDNTLTSIIL